MIIVVNSTPNNSAMTELRSSASQFVVVAVVIVMADIITEKCGWRGALLERVTKKTYFDHETVLFRAVEDQFGICPLLYWIRTENPSFSVSCRHSFMKWHPLFSFLTNTHPLLATFPAFFWPTVTVLVFLAIPDLCWFCASPFFLVFPDLCDNFLENLPLFPVKCNPCFLALFCPCVLIFNRYKTGP